MAAVIGRESYRGPGWSIVARSAAHGVPEENPAFVVGSIATFVAGG